MISRTLMCYGTRYGSTGEIAEKIAKILRTEGITVETVDLKKEKVKDLASYDLVVVGSGIRANRWTKEPKKFLDKNKASLSEKRVAIFVSCGSANEPDKCDEARKKYLQQIALDYPEIKIISMGLFGPKYDSTRGNFFTKKIMRTIVKEHAEDPENPPDIIDLRDWEKIEQWTRSLIDD